MTTTWTRALSRRRRALYISSPIGLGHAQRDASIAVELRKLHPDLEIDWLAQSPVTDVLEARGERIHPASAWLANESAHIQSEAAGHELNAFEAIRRMDEILIANFMVFHDVVEAGDYDLVIGDEAWDIDYYLHENPELKRTAFAWMTDFVGWLPMPEGGEREAYLTSDLNAEMIEHVEQFPRLRDRAIFVGDPEDIVPDDFGPGLPRIRDWTERHFAFSGYVTGFDPAPLVAEREVLRRELGYHDDERVVIVTVGGSGVGRALLERVIDSYPEAARRVPGLRMIAVAGPRIDPASLGAAPGVEVRAFVPDLYRHLIAADLAVVQGGLTTTMELAAGRRPFLYFPLERHFEQNRHVAHRMSTPPAPTDRVVELAVELGRLGRHLDALGAGPAHAPSWPQRAARTRAGCPDPGPPVPVPPAYGQPHPSGWRPGQLRTRTLLPGAAAARAVPRPGPSYAHPPYPPPPRPSAAAHSGPSAAAAPRSTSLRARVAVGRTAARVDRRGRDPARRRPAAGVGGDPRMGRPAHASRSRRRSRRRPGRPGHAAAPPGDRADRSAGPRRDGRRDPLPGRRRRDRALRLPARAPSASCWPCSSPRWDSGWPLGGGPRSSPVALWSERRSLRLW